MKEIRAAFPAQDCLLIVDPFGQSNKPSQEISPPRTPQIDALSEADGLENLDLDCSDSIDENKEPVVAVIGCGYVGTQLIGSFSSHYDVLGFDVSKEQLRRLEEEFGGEGSRVSFTLDPRNLSRATHFLISVPTLLKADKTIDTSYVRSALTNVWKYARPGSTVVIESSVAIGMTRQLLGPLAKEKGFFAGMSPERIDPGRTDPPMHVIPKVISGLDDVVPGSLAAITRLYSRVFDSIVPVSTPETAEMTKLYENCQRMIAITYANEMADACIGHGIDPYEVCRAASTKPFGYTPFTPGLGVGGHCIPVNPYYLMANSSFPLLKMATETTWQRPEKIGQRVLDALFREAPHNTSTQTSANSESLHLSKESDFKHVERTETTSRISRSEKSSSLFRPRVLVVGVGFKAGQSHLSNSPGLKLIQTLADSGRVDVMFADALVKQTAIPHIPRLDMSDWNKSSLEGFDMIIIAFKQKDMDFKVLDEVQNVRVEMWCP
ncbi:nucleotide sugar dehydrogenase [Daldinia vernicosa]|uniref:nucleotide sugar dehydrogenase n=1 Tax=Daldinia vernicosa TaxID=114800 RepID=UPI0020087AC2|nr:nucleotide sugar dehydrogenase [Daldinia vernicosa]KAI0846246.1 nucleotide sugar dehydrogenase [Daldinia vernicosa]